MLQQIKMNEKIGRGIKTLNPSLGFLAKLIQGDKEHATITSLIEHSPKYSKNNPRRRLTHPNHMHEETLVS
jgi:hypothetical protein